MKTPTPAAIARFQAAFPEVAASIGYLIQDNQHGEAVLELAIAVDGPAADFSDTLPGADQRALHALEALHGSLGHTTGAMLALRGEICARVKVRAARYLSPEQIAALKL